MTVAKVPGAPAGGIAPLATAGARRPCYPVEPPIALLPALDELAAGRLGTRAPVEVSMYLGRSVNQLVGACGAALLLAAVAPRVAAAAVPEDACALLSQAQVAAAARVAVGAGTYVTPTFKKTCTWNRAAGATGGLRAVTLNVTQSSAFEAGKQIVGAAAARVKARPGGDPSHMAVQAASGVGDDAYFISMGSGYTALMVKKGGVALKVAVYGDVPRDEAAAIEKTLAAEAVAKL
jgi:hypothetical protein